METIWKSAEAKCSSHPGNTGSIVNPIFIDISGVFKKQLKGPPVLADLERDNDFASVLTVRLSTLSVHRLLLTLVVVPSSVRKRDCATGTINNESFSDGFT